MTQSAVILEKDSQPSFTSTGEKAKARDILTAIRTLKLIERDHRPATQAERQDLSRFGGFGAVALSIFPDPVTGRFKDGWQGIGEELKSILTPEEYDSAKRHDLHRVLHFPHRHEVHARSPFAFRGFPRRRHP